GRPSSKRRRRRILLTAVTVLIAAAFGGYSIYRKRELPIKVQTEKVTRRNLTETVVANGKVQPVLQVVINPEVSGEITGVAVKESEVCEKGRSAFEDQARQLQGEP